MRRNRVQVRTDLFPFLSVLCSIIGVLMLFLVTILATRVIQASPQPSAATSEDAEPAAIDVNDGIPEEEWTRLNSQIDDVSAELTATLSQGQQLAALRNQLKAAIEDKEDESLIPAQGEGSPIALDVAESVEIIPDSSVKTTKTPVFVEVSADGYLFYLSGREPVHFPPVLNTDSIEKPVPNATSQLESQLAALIRETESIYLVFLLHPDGVKALESIRSLLEGKLGDVKTWTEGPWIFRQRVSRIDLGVEPFSPHLKLAIEQLQSKPKQR